MQLKILQRVYAMTIYGNISLRQFPKHEKHVMVADIRRSMYALIRLIITANKRRNKKRYLEDIDIELDVLRTLIRLSVEPDLKYLPFQKYETWSKMLSEIGRMLGGWMRTV